MGSIHVLDQELINQIAAGEVIERPASVVKELVENAIDADAASISVEIEGSGIDLIRVADDGRGMTGDELELAVLRHATSKISHTHDLFSIRTLGFRGEALPSIASVSRSMIATRPRDSQAGWYLSMEAGGAVEKGMKGMPPGTVVEVKDLFFNTPARRKFLKATQTEQRHIIDIISRYALAYPQIRFNLSINGRTLLSLKPGSTLEERIAGIWGKEVNGKLRPLSDERPAITISGILASPEISRPSRSGIYTYVNQRSVMDQSLRSAVLEGYRGLLMKQRYPLAVVFIDMEPSEVDVNVHPAKAEVRFRNPSAMFGMVVNAIRRAFGQGSSYPAEAPAAKTIEYRAEEAERPYRSLHQEAGEPVRRPLPVPTPQTNPAVQQDMFERKVAGITYADKSIIGLFQSTYILLEDGLSLIILDQHAAHERVTYERLRNGSSGSGSPVQDLLTPLVIELSPVEFSAFEEVAEDIRKIGIGAEAFGNEAIAVRSVPSILNQADIRGIVHDLLSAVLAGDLRRKEYRNDVLARIACHSSVRAGKKLQTAEIDALLRDLDEVGSPLTCPHGRPLFKQIGRDEIERWIGRRPLS